MNSNNKEKPTLRLQNFALPLTRSEDEYFLDFLKRKLTEYSGFYDEHMTQEASEDFELPEDVHLFSLKMGTTKLAREIVTVVNLYLQGKVFEATLAFNIALDKCIEDDSLHIETLRKEKIFYRSRQTDEIEVSARGIFHVPFEKRHLVQSNRFSIPGLPALYMCDSTYLCWEESNRKDFRKMWFSALKPKRNLNVITILREEDLYSRDMSFGEDFIDHKMARFFWAYPLNLACSIKVLHPNGTFKPEYIIPQLLMQYVSEKPDIDGIMYPSTKVNYSKLTGIDAYNYVFPVKSSQKEGHCPILSGLFELTEPTSLDLEELIKSASAFSLKPDFFNLVQSPKVELVSGVKTEYNTSSFGKLELILAERDFVSLNNSDGK